MINAILDTQGEAPIPRTSLVMAGRKILDCGPMERQPASDAPRLSLPRPAADTRADQHPHLCRALADKRHRHEYGLCAGPYAGSAAFNAEEAVALAWPGTMESLLTGSSVMVDSHVHGEVTLPAIADLGRRISAGASRAAHPGLRSAA